MQNTGERNEGIEKEWNSKVMEGEYRRRGGHFKEIYGKGSEDTRY